jgi:hypothetical protein
LSFSQVAAVVERVLERPVRYQEVAANTFVQSLVASGASAEYSQGLLAMFAELARGVMRGEPQTFEATTPTALGAWVREELLPLTGADFCDPSTMVCTA